MKNDDDGNILSLMTWNETGGHITIVGGSTVKCDWFANLFMYRYNTIQLQLNAWENIH